MKTLYPLHGILTALNIPYTTEGSIDFESLQRHVDYAAQAGVAGFLVPVMAGEVGKLTFEERSEIVDCVLQANAGRCVVVGGATAGSCGECLRQGELLLKKGCQGILSAVPYTGNWEAYRNYVQTLDTLKPEFLMLQDWDSSGYGVPVPLLTQLFEEVESFRCLKIEVVPAGSKYTAMLQATGGQLNISGGWAVNQLIEALDRGVHAFVPTGMHQIYCKIVELYHQGCRRNAVRLYEQLQPILAFSNQHLDISIWFFKRLLWRQGIYATPDVRQPILEFDAYHRAIADELIEKAIALMDQVDRGAFDAPL